MFKRNYLGITLLLLGLILSASTPAFATNQRPVTLRYDMVLLGTPLRAGEYTIRWQSHSPTATVTVSNGRKVLATTEAKLVGRGVKYDRDFVVFDTKADGTKTIREIRPAGSSHAIVFYE